MLKKLFIISILVSLSSLSYAKEVYETDFDAGVKNFEKKDYKSALKYFKKAQSLGMKESVLKFNIAVSYYRLGLYKKSKKVFKTLTKDKKFQQIAYYNLGLIAEKEKNKNSAIRLYKKSVAYNKATDIAQLANKKIDKLLKRNKKKKAAKVRASVSLAYGRDDNVTGEAENSPSNSSDNYLEMFAYVKAPLTKNLNIKGNLYKLDYSTESIYNYDFYSAAIDYRIKTGNWRLTPEINLIKSSFGNTDYQSVTDFKFSAKRKFNRSSSLAMRYRYSDINSENPGYDYLQGDRHQFRVDYKDKTALGKMRLRYQLETNDRQNRITPTEKNYSPTRHTFRARLKHKLGDKWRLSEELGYRVSSYGSTATETREDKRLRLRVIADIKLDKNWLAGIKYIYTDNDSNIAAEKYTRNNIQLFGRWTY